MTQQRTNLRRGVASLLASALLAAPIATLAVVPAAVAAPEDLTSIAEIQGTGPETTLTGTVTTRGVVTAAYPTGGFNGFVIQTEGTGPGNKTTDASDAIFVYGSSAANQTVGTFVEVTGVPGEFSGLTQLSSPTVTVLPESETFTAPQPIELEWPETDEAREIYESMLVTPTGDYTVSNTYATNQYGEVGLAFGTKPLEQPTEIARPNSSAAEGVVDDNEARSVRLDDGATTNFFNARNDTPPYVSLVNPVRVGAGVTFTDPVIVDYRNNAWKFNPTQHTPAGEEIATFENTRTAAPDASKLGAATHTIAAFNVLNYFTTTGVDSTCAQSYADRAGRGITVRSCGDAGPRGAWDADSLKRQEDKIVAAINAVDASVVGLMEIENSAKLGEQADEATATLVAKLNAAAGSDTWDYVPSSSDLPEIAQQDVITNAIIYKKADVEPLGSARALGTLSGSGQPFSNAREPLGQAFNPVGSSDPFFVVVNHFKSKGSGTGADADQNDGQGASNASRVAQATALTAWVPDALDAIETETGVAVEDTALIGDFNSYTEEDPMYVFYDAGYKNATKEHNLGEYSYSFSGLSGSLDHIVYNSSFADRVTGSDIWEINSPESIALEYSRYNNHGTLFYADDVYRSSDHDPVILGFTSAAESATTTTINLLDINDFHGRIDSNTVKFAGTVEELRAEHGEDNTLFLSAGDNIGASLFASSVQQDTPTIEVLNALDLAASAVGNHEFDQGLTDLTGRVTDEADFPHLGANVYQKGTEEPALQEFEVFEIEDIRVGVIGAVTQETPALVSPGGIATLDFGDAVEAVNRVAAQLTDGNEANGEADVLVALYHEGAGAGTPDGSSLAQELAAGGAFANIVTKTNDNVAAIFTGHTHKQYAWLADNGAKNERPVVQTGSYGEHIGQIVLTVDKDSKEVVDATARNVPRVDTEDDELVATYPRVAAVQSIVADALAVAKVEGDKPVGSIAADITSAYTSGEYVDGKFTAGSEGERDNRAEASALGNLVADSLRETLSAQERGGADIGVVNPGGLRADLMRGEDGVITYAEANAVLPFVNSLWTTDLTGAQVKTMLEQQWQTNEDGTIPSRPYLQLGLSNNVTYTYDESRDAGDRITSITVNGAPIDPETVYTIGTFSFLAQGGDNFRVFNDTTGTRDSGLIDRDAWVAYLDSNPNLEPNFARSGVSVAGFDSAMNVEPGETVEFELERLNVFSLGAPDNTELEVWWSGGKLASAVSGGSVAVSNDTATASLTVPEGAAGAESLVFVANPSNTAVVLEVAVAGDSTTPDAGEGTTPDAGEGDNEDADVQDTTSPTGDSEEMADTGAGAAVLLASLALVLIVGGAVALRMRRE